MKTGNSQIQETQQIPSPPSKKKKKPTKKTTPRHIAVKSLKANTHVNTDSQDSIRTIAEFLSEATQRGHSKQCHSGVERNNFNLESYPQKKVFQNRVLAALFRWTATEEFITSRVTPPEMLVEVTQAEGGNGKWKQGPTQRHGERWEW